ncbi:MAG: HAMP domain-containing histidine kinase [Proteobacteria bacterium]|nr:HAMP domain-containing histidine kinase [Pseudomonadota bacterium]
MSSTGLRTLWRRASEPSLLWRSTWAMVGVFALIWLALLAYLYLENRKSLAEAPGLQKYGDALLVALDETADAQQARAAIAATERWTAIRRTQSEVVSGVVLHELSSPDGRIVYRSPAWNWNGSVPSSAVSITLQEGYWRYDRASTHWRLRILNPRRTSEAFLRYNARNILPYLLVAFPIVLGAVWLTLRASLRPLQQLAGRIGERSSGDLSPVGVPARYRELKPLVDALDALLLRLRGTVERERAFIQDAAHEIRTPLAVINAQAHVLAQAPDAAQRNQAEEQLNQAIGRTSHLAQQLLDLASLDRAGPLRSSRVDLALWLRKLLGPAAQAALRDGRELSLDAPDTLPCDIELASMESIVQNLVDNALRHAVPASTIAVALRLEGQALLLQVLDDGPGIPGAHQEHIFERFHRAADARASGAGLGLAIVRQAALRLGGGVELTQGLSGRGVGFRVRLPLAGAPR